MNLQTLLGDSYKTDITLEEIDEYLKDKEFVDKSVLPKSVDKAKFDKTASELAAANKRVKELESENMTSEQKLQAALDAAEQARVDFKKKSSKLEVEKILVGAGLTEKDYNTLIDGIVQEDEETSKTLANQLVSVIASQREKIENSLKSELLKQTPKPQNGYKDDLAINEFKNMTLTDKAKFKLEHPEEYKILSGGK